jgi:signal transduction histidine kinase
VLKFHQIVLRKFLALFLALFLIVGAIIYYWIYEYYINSSKEAFKQDIELIALQITPTTNLDNLAKEIKSKLHIRLTIIDQDGKVLAESHNNKTSMENHRYRNEIMQADTQEYGVAIRESHTLHKKLLYVAKKITLEKKILYIRLAKEIVGIESEIISLGIKILIVLILFFIAVFVVTYKINIQIQRETKKIVTFLKSLTKKEKLTYIHSTYSEEFEHITNLLTKVSQILVKKDKQKSKYTQTLLESNKQKDDIISAISHEFKNPIAVVNGYSQTLLEDDKLNITIRRKFLKKIYNNGLKLSNLIDTLRLSMKLDGEQQTLSTKKVKLYDLVEDLVQNLQINYPDRDVIIEGDENATVQVDETLFGIVITNLIENAFKYSEDEVHVKISSESLEVIDTGIGIDKKEIQNITEKFYRIHKNSWNNSLGLGLFLVNKILSLHHFKLHITSKINKGSTFKVIFS